VHAVQARTAVALLDTLGIQRAYWVGNSQGGTLLQARNLSRNKLSAEPVHGKRIRGMPSMASADPQAELVLDEVAHSESTGAIGMYELQLWLGLKALQRLGQGPAAVPAARGGSFLARLAAALPPTTEAGAIQSDLLRWLEELREAGWRLDRTACDRPACGARARQIFRWTSPPNVGEEIPDLEDPVC
jgi:pimeloyl-ACP methyl ester carboxylesterase